MMKKMTQKTELSATSAAPAYGDVPCSVEQLAELSDADLRAVAGGGMRDMLRQKLIRAARERALSLI